MAVEKKVLIITYYWPPSGGSGVQRWLKFVKYLPHFGYTPYVFTPENPSFDVKDESLEKDVPMEAEIIRFPIWEPYKAFFKVSQLFGGVNKSTPTHLVSGKKKSFFQKWSTWMRGNFIMPDPRVFWVKPSVKFLTDFIRDNHITTVITTGPPHSIHLIGLRLKKKDPSLRWLADFRDPWSEWGFLDSLLVSKPARSIHKRLESSVLKTADIITTITPFYVRRFEALSGKKVELLTNGYDEDDFKTLAPRRTGQFVIRHVGIVNEKCNPRPFMQALQELILEDPEFARAVRMDFVGEVHPDFKAFVQERTELNQVTTFTPAVPHKQLIQLYNESSLLLLVLEGYKDAEGYMPGKLFEYLATGLPVVGVGPEHGDASLLMERSDHERMIDGSDIQKIKARIMVCFAQWKKSDTVNLSLLSKSYSRKELTKGLVALLQDQ